MEGGEGDGERERGGVPSVGEEGEKMGAAGGRIWTGNVPSTACGSRGPRVRVVRWFVRVEIVGDALEGHGLRDASFVEGRIGVSRALVWTEAGERLRELDTAPALGGLDETGHLRGSANPFIVGAAENEVDIPLTSLIPLVALKRSVAESELLLSPLG